MCFVKFYLSKKNKCAQLVWLEVCYKIDVKVIIVEHEEKIFENGENQDIIVKKRKNSNTIKYKSSVD